MKSRFKFSKNIPELLLTTIIMVIIISDGFSIPLIIVLALLSVLILSQNKILGIVFGILAVIISMYMLGAVYSEFSEFPVKDKESLTLLFVGTSLFLGTLVLSALMLVKYIMLLREIRH